MTRYVRTGAVVLLAALFAVLAVLVAPRAEAATPDQDPAPVCATWGLRSIVQDWMDPAEGSEVVNSTTVKLTKPEGGGTEFAAFDVEFTAETETQVMVHYATGNGAATTAGAVRMFGYAEQDANTLTDGPDWVAVAEADEGNLLFTLPAGTELGTLGLVYDASNSAGGHVTFTDMVVGDRPVSFTECPDPSPSPSVSPSASATPEPSASATTPAPAGTTVAPPPAAGPSLPVTGVSLPQVIAGGALLLIVGAVAYLVAPALRRRKRTTFQA